MRRFRFTGPEPVDVPRLRLVGIEAGQVVEVDDKEADGFKGQSQWEPVRAKKES